MKRLLALILLLPLAGIAATPTTPPDTSIAAIQRQMTALQTQMNALAQKMAALSAKAGNDANATALRYLADGRRALLGIATRDENGRTTVVAVSPGSPAERAGVEVGDVITGFTARSMTFHGDDHTPDLADLQVGERVELTVQRKGKVLHLQATPERFSSDDWRATVHAAERAANAAAARASSAELNAQLQEKLSETMRERAQARAEKMARRLSEVYARTGDDDWNFSWWGLNLAPLNPDLGRYFGTDTGTLVLSCDADRYPELQPGDVITRVGDHPVAQPQDAMRAFRDASDAKPIAVEVRRHGKLITLALKTPPRGMMLPPPPPPMPPMPAVPAVPPTPQAPPPPPSPPMPPAAHHSL